MSTARSWVEISSQAILHNIKSLRDNLPKSTDIAPVLKANAYGHGLECLASIIPKKRHTFCVDSIEEAIQLRNFRASDELILIMGVIPESSMRFIDDSMLPVVYDIDYMIALAALRPKQRIHIKVETGLNRQGLQIHELPDFLALVRKLELRPVGAYTHFANVEDTLDSSFFNMQYDSFCKALKLFPSDVCRHSCASAAALLHPRQAGDMVRVGISLYGYFSSWQTLLSLRERGVKCDLRPAMSWKCRIAQIKEVRSGDRVGYGCTHEVLRTGKIAVLPVGYYDGYCRLYSNRSTVLINGRRAPVIGRVAMNMCMIDVSHLSGVSNGQIVTLLGDDESGESISAEELAEISQTIPYEVLTRVASHLPRKVVSSKGVVSEY